MSVNRHMMQRSPFFFPGIRNKPWWDGLEIPMVVELEKHHAIIRREFENILLCGRLGLHPQSKDGPRKQIADGDWSIFSLCSGGGIHERNSLEAPITSCLIKDAGDLVTHPAGVGYFSVLAPKLHISAHCGRSNTRIRIHLGLRVPEGAVMRVGNITKTWREGRCLVFDDSWEHEVFNRSNFIRAVLLLDVWHPDLSPEQRSAISRTEAPTGQRKQREGWQRALGTSDDKLDDSTLIWEYRNILHALSADRFSSVLSSAQKVRSSEQAFVATSANLVVTIAQDSRLFGEILRSADKCKLNAPIMEYLADLLHCQPDYRLTDEDLINIVGMCSLLWRTDLRNRQRMHEFIDSWPTSSKIQMASELVKCGTLREMIRHLAGKLKTSDEVPFGAAAPLIIATAQQGLTAAERQSDGLVHGRG